MQNDYIYMACGVYVLVHKRSQWIIGGNGWGYDIGYSPCIAHGLKAGMGKAQAEQKAAVECGYWHLWRYDPRLAEGKNPFLLDSKEPDWTKFQDFLKGEARFVSLSKQYPVEAQEF